MLYSSQPPCTYLFILNILILKKIIVLIIVILFTGFTLYQCQKSDSLELDKQEKSLANSVDSRSDFDGTEMIPLSNDDLCAPAYPDCVPIQDYPIWLTPVSSLLPPGIVGDCQVAGVYDICVV